MQIKFNIIIKAFDIVSNLTIILIIFFDVEIDVEMLVKYRRTENLIEIDLYRFAINILLS